MTSPWDKSWQELQTQYLEAMGMITRSSKAANFTDFPFFEGTGFPGAGLFTPPSAASPGASPGLSEFIHSCHYWGRFAEQFSHLMRGMAAAGEAGEEWQKLLDDQIDTIKVTLSGESKADKEDSFSRIINMQMDYWRKNFEALSPGNPFAGSTRSTMNNAPLFEAFQAAYSATDRAGFQVFPQPWRDCQEKFIQYQQLLQSIDLESLDRLREKILEVANNGESISGAKEVFKLWVDSHEEVWTRHICTEEYSKLYGEITNSLVLLQKNYQDFLNSAQSMNPTDSMGGGEELAALKAQHEEDKKRIASLEKELSTVRARTESKARKKPTARKKKSKASSKKAD